VSKISRLACALSLVAAVACQKATDDPAPVGAFDDARVHRVQVEVTTPEISPMPAIAT